jgi:hypothetical protein
MASIHRDIPIASSPERVWSAVRDVGAPHVRLAPGVVVDCRRDGDHRVVTFAGGAVVRELIIDLDETRRRLAYAVVESALGFTHHHATMQVLPGTTGDDCRLVWVSDLTPDALSWPVADLMDQCAEAVQRTLAVEARDAGGLTVS